MPVCQLSFFDLPFCNAGFFRFRLCALFCFKSFRRLVLGLFLCLAGFFGLSLKLLVRQPSVFCLSLGVVGFSARSFRVLLRPNLVPRVHAVPKRPVWP